MNNSFYGATLTSKNTCDIAIFSNISKPDNKPINLVINEAKYIPLEIKKQAFLNGVSLYTCYYEDGFELGNDYEIFIENFGLAPLNMTPALDFEDFEKKYYYPFNDLGFTYSKEKTTFKIWAPLASRCEIYIKKSLDEDFIYVYKLNRDNYGVFSITLDGDFDGYIYKYKIKNNGIERFATDPYGIASTSNGEANYVIDIDKTKIDLYENDLPIYDNYTNTIIYELHVRDFSIDNSVNFKNKGKFLAFTEENLKTKNGNKAGIDYLSDIGVTHIQLLPIYDYKTVDELTCKNYNRGYDPQQYFVPEGSYSLNPNNPYSRIVECKKMIQALHKKKLKVNMDVVYNHVYDYLNSSFEKIVPGYYFRKNNDGTLCNGSGCGNDFATNKPMVRKLIVDCCKYWIKEYGIDGFRFDLMGLIDVETISQILKIGKAIKPDFMIYGEGWDMSTNLKSEDKASILNSFKMPHVAFFNDSFRDVLKGPTQKDQLHNPGYLTGNPLYIEGFKFCYLGSCLNFVYPRRFLSPNQSINYVECHDNFTLFDKVSSVYNIKNINTIKETINLINASILISFGVPFFHAGQEFCLSKDYEDNTYNSGDLLNSIKWNQIDENIELVNYFKSFIKLRKKINEFQMNDPEIIGKINNFKNLSDGILEISLKFNKCLLKIIINPTDHEFNYELDDYYQLIANEAGYMEDGFINLSRSAIKKHCIYIFKKEEN